MNVVWSVESLSDLKHVRQFIEDDDKTAAAQVVLTILESTKGQPNAFPESGRVGRVAGTYELVIPHLPYIVLYRTISHNVQIIRVYHTSRMWPDKVS